MQARGEARSLGTVVGVARGSWRAGGQHPGVGSACGVLHAADKALCEDHLMPAGSAVGYPGKKPSAEMTPNKHPLTQLHTVKPVALAWKAPGQ